MELVEHFDNYGSFVMSFNFIQKDITLPCYYVEKCHTAVDDIISITTQMKLLTVIVKKLRMCVVPDLRLHKNFMNDHTILVTVFHQCLLNNSMSVGVPLLQLGLMIISRLSCRLEVF